MCLWVPWVMSYTRAKTSLPILFISVEIVQERFRICWLFKISAIRLGKKGNWTDNSKSYKEQIKKSVQPYFILLQSYARVIFVEQGRQGGVRTAFFRCSSQIPPLFFSRRFSLCSPTKTMPARTSPSGIWNARVSLQHQTSLTTCLVSNTV